MSLQPKLQGHRFAKRIADQCAAIAAASCRRCAGNDTAAAGQGDGMRVPWRRRGSLIVAFDVAAPRLAASLIFVGARLTVPGAR